MDEDDSFVDMADDDEMQPSSSSKNREQRRRPRISTACEFCKARKVKCNGLKPCDTCKAKGIEADACVYAERHKQKNEVQELLERVKTLETALGSAAKQAAESSIGSPPVSAPLVAVSSPAPASVVAPPLVGGTAATSTGKATGIVGTASPVAFRAVVSPFDKYAGGPSSVRGSSGDKSKRSPGSGSASSANVSDISPDSLSHIAPFPLVPGSGLDPPILIDGALYRSLMVTFLNTYWPSMPVLHPPSLLDRPDAYPNYLIVILLAIVIKNSRDPRLEPIAAACGQRTNQELSQQLIDRILPALKARKDSFATTLTDPMLLQGMFHAIQYHGYEPGASFRTTQLLDGMVLSIRDVPVFEFLRQDRIGDDWIRWEEHRRLFWRLFMFDVTYSTMSSIRSFGISREVLERVPLPCSEEHFLARVGQPEPFFTLEMLRVDPRILGLKIPTADGLLRMFLLFTLLREIVEYQRLPTAVLRTMEMRQYLEAQLAAWDRFLAVPAAVLDVRKPPSSPSVSLVDQSALKVPPVVVLLLYYYICIILYAPPFLAGAMDNVDWLSSRDFVLAFQSSSRFIACLEGVEIVQLPMWASEGITLATQIHLIAIRRLAEYFEPSFAEEVKSNIVSAIAVYESLGSRRFQSNQMSFFLKLAMTKIAKDTSYFGDDPPPDNLSLEEVAPFVLASNGFKRKEDFLGVMANLFGANGRPLSTMSFFTEYVEML